MNMDVLSSYMPQWKLHAWRVASADLRDEASSHSVSQRPGNIVWGVAAKHAMVLTE